MDEDIATILNQIADTTTARVLARDYRAIQGLLLGGEGMRVVQTKGTGPDGRPCTTRISMALERKSTIALRVSVTWAHRSVERSRRYRWQHVRRCWEPQLPEDDV